MLLNAKITSPEEYSHFQCKILIYKISILTGNSRGPFYGPPARSQRRFEFRWVGQPVSQLIPNRSRRLNMVALEFATVSSSMQILLGPCSVPSECFPRKSTGVVGGTRQMGGPGPLMGDGRARGSHFPMELGACGITDAALCVSSNRSSAVPCSRCCG
jgi:hypothetical protein